MEIVKVKNVLRNAMMIKCNQSMDVGTSANRRKRQLPVKKALALPNKPNESPDENLGNLENNVSRNNMDLENFSRINNFSMLGKDHFGVLVTLLSASL